MIDEILKELGVPEAAERYGNSLWPDKVPELSGPEAVAAAKRLYRFAMKRKLAYKVKVTSGRRYTWVRYRVLSVNPERGWRDLVHMLSHWCHRALYPLKRPHDPTHESLERAMVEYVLRSGFLDGKLRPAPRPAKPKPNIIEVRQKRVMARLAAWESKAKRAATAIKKLRQQARYYEVTVAKRRGEP